MHSYKQLVFTRRIITFLGFSIITIEFAEEKEKYLGQAEAATGIGLALGPTIGSLMYAQVGYMFTFVIFGVILILGTILAFFMLPQSLNLSGEAQELDTVTQRIHKDISLDTQ